MTLPALGKNGSPKRVAGARLVDDLVEHVRDRILTGELEPGTRLSEQGLASEYSVARPTVRSAIDVLISHGLLTRPAHSQPRVATITPADLPEIVALLEVTEDHALRRILTLDADLRPVRRAVGSSHHHVLHAMVTVAGSERLTAVHRRCTYEYLLAEPAVLASAGPLPQAGDVDDPVELQRALLAALAGAGEGQPAVGLSQRPAAVSETNTGQGSGFGDAGDAAFAALAALRSRRRLVQDAAALTAAAL